MMLRPLLSVFERFKRAVTASVPGCAGYIRHEQFRNIAHSLRMQPDMSVIQQTEDTDVYGSSALEAG